MKLNIKEVWKKNKKVILIVFFVIFCYNSNGSIALWMYSNTYFLTQTDISHATQLSNVMFVFQIIGTTICVTIADKYPRKDYFLYSQISLGILFGLLSLTQLFESNKTAFHISIGLI